MCFINFKFSFNFKLLPLEKNKVASCVWRDIFRLSLTSSFSSHPQSLSPPVSRWFCAEQRPERGGAGCWLGSNEKTMSVRARVPFMGVNPSSVNDCTKCEARAVGSCCLSTGSEDVLKIEAVSLTDTLHLFVCCFRESSQAMYTMQTFHLSLFKATCARHDACAPHTH